MPVLQTADGRTVDLGAMMGGGPQGPEQAPGQGGAGEHLRAALEEMRAAAPLADNEQDRLLIEKVKTLIQQILAVAEKDRDAALGVTGNLRAMSRGGY